MTDIYLFSEPGSPPPIKVDGLLALCLVSGFFFLLTLIKSL